MLSQLTFQEEKEGHSERIIKLATNSRNKSIRDLYRGIHSFKQGY
jgi:hypothetical protein